MAEQSISKEERLLNLLYFFEEIQNLLEEEFNQELFEKVLDRIGNFFKVSKIYFVKCFGVNYWEVRFSWAKEKQILKTHISGNWENLVSLYSYLSTGNPVTDDIAEYSQELSKWKSYFKASNILLIPIVKDKKLFGIFILQDVEKKFFYNEEILVLKQIFYNLTKLQEFSDKIDFLRTTNSELRREFENFNRLYNLIPALIIQKSENLKYENVNENFLKFLGKKKFEVLNKSDFELFSETTAQEIVKADIEALESETNSTQIHEIKFEQKKYYFLFYRVVFTDPDTKLKHLLSVAVDITEIFEEKIRSEIASKAKSEFLANMSHELRTPLNSIIGFIELLLQEDFEPEQREILLNIRQSSYSLLELINDILDLNKIEAGKLEFNPIPTSISKILNEVKILFKERFESKGLNLEIIKEKSVPDVIIIDPLRLKQILINLVGNAYKFTNQGKVTISLRNLSTAMRVGETAHLEFSVSDTGIGIPEDKLGLIFEAFTQAEKDTAQKFGGTGLGLTITKKFVEMMGGKITVHSEVGKGSTFTFIIPVEIGQEIPKEEEEKIELENLVGSKSPYSPLILIIEDDLETAKLIERHLKDKEFKLLISQTAKDGFLNAKKYHPDLILLDIFLPDKSGWEVLRELKSDVITKSIPVVICSIQKEINKAFSFGAIDYLEKPVSVNKLQSLINSWKEKFSIKDKIIVVDDDTKVLQRIDAILTKNGFEVECFDDPELALKKVKEKKSPHLIILDLMMPKMDGFEFLTEIRKDDDLVSVPVIILTSKKLLDEEIKFLEERTSGIFFKESFDEKVFLERLDKLLQKIQDAKKASIVSSAKPEKQIKSPLPPLHVLLVEDNLMNQKFMSHILKRLGSTFDIAIDGRDAIEKVKQNKYDIILMDIQMPVMDGLEATRYIRNELKMKDIPIIALTAHAMKGDREKCIEAGCNGYITKPIDQQKLVSEIMSVIKSTEPEYEEINPYFQGFSRDEIIQLRREYIESMRQEVEQLDKKISPKEFEAFKFFGHNIKGNGVAYGFPEISKFGAKIEDAAANQDYPTLVTVFNEFKNYLSSIKV